MYFLMDFLEGENGWSVDFRDKGLQSDGKPLAAWILPARRQFDRIRGQVLLIDFVQNAADAVRARVALDIGVENIPGRLFGIHIYDLGFHLLRIFQPLTAGG